MSDLLLLGFYVGIMALGWWGERWLTRREAKRRVVLPREPHGQPMTLPRSWRQFATRPVNGPNLRPDVLRVPGETDEEIIGWLVDGHFQRRGEW